MAKDAAPAPLTGAIAAEAVQYRARAGETLLDGVSLDVRPGERLAVIGPNGAGKSTLLKVLSGRLRPSAGRVLLDGDDLARVERARRARRIAVMAQSDRPDERLRARDYVALGRIPHARTASVEDNGAVVARALALVGMTAFADHPLGRLSGGERQKLTLARALAQEPSVLLLDEPTNNLDPRARAELLSTVAGLGVTVVAVLHDLTLAPDFADRVAVLADSRLVCCAPPAQALADDVIASVFDLSVFRLPHPRDGRPLFVFDAGATLAAQEKTT